MTAGGEVVEDNNFFGAAVMRPPESLISADSAVMELRANSLKEKREHKSGHFAENAIAPETQAINATHNSEIISTEVEQRFNSVGNNNNEYVDDI